jgi:signal transduction histidine kinase
MERQRRSVLIYGLLLGIWLLLVGWQIEDHMRVRSVARMMLVNQAKDISSTMGIVLRSQRRFGGVVSKERLEASLTELVNQERYELDAIAVLNAVGDVVASAGSGIDYSNLEISTSPEIWGAQTVTLLNPVDLGTNLTRDFEGTNLPIILSRNEFTNRFGPPRPLGPPPGPPPGDDASNGSAVAMAGGPPPPPPDLSTNRDRPPGGGRPRFGGRPRWMTDEQYQTMLQEKGVHSFAIVMSTLPLHIIFRYDLWLRSFIVFFAGIAAIVAGVAWRKISQTADLQIRLVRASELNSHLKEMNLAAAGLAHETRNPLNIIRGMAQMMSKSDAPPDLKEKSRAIVDETDKVTAQLNEFINYSRPREVRRARVALNAVVAEVVRALNYDIDEKKISVEAGLEPLTIEADEQLLRQALFNLLLNAIQAVGPGGHIQFVARKDSADEAEMEIRDDGPGVPPEQRQEIFKPYFTTHQKGTGLGLAVVQQIVLAHGWEIQCLANDPRGAVFRLRHLKPVA